jgi:hypothetical protein
MQPKIAILNDLIDIGKLFLPFTRVPRRIWSGFMAARRANAASKLARRLDIEFFSRWNM